MKEQKKEISDLNIQVANLKGKLEYATDTKEKQKIEAELKDAQKDLSAKTTQQALNEKEIKRLENEVDKAHNT